VALPECRRGVQKWPNADGQRPVTLASQMPDKGSLTPRRNAAAKAREFFRVFKRQAWRQHGVRNSSAGQRQSRPQEAESELADVPCRAKYKAKARKHRHGGQTLCEPAVYVVEMSYRISWAAARRINGEFPLEGKMSKSTTLMVAVATLAPLASVPTIAEDTVTVYSAGGLHDGTPNWYQNQFDAFSKATGIKVQYIEAGLRRRG
jgi:hypothetical protein